MEFDNLVIANFNYLKRIWKIKIRRLFCSNLHWRAYNPFTKIKLHRHKEEEEDHSFEDFFFLEKPKSRDLKLSLSPCLEGGDGMKGNKNNNFRIFFPFSCLGVLIEGMESSFSHLGLSNGRE